jgi:ribosomal RNA-processing protein 36
MTSFAVNCETVVPVMTGSNRSMAVAMGTTAENPKKPGAPREMSTKHVGGGQSFLTQAGPRRIDPRFREECGEIDHIGIVKNYALVQQHREAELAAINRTLESDAPDIDPQVLKRQKQSLEDQHKTFGEKLRDVEDRIRWHREEKERIREGKKPFWLDRRSMQERDRKRKFQELQASGKMERYLRRRGKKLAAKDRKQGSVAGVM